MLKQRVLSAIVLIAIVFAVLFLFSPFYFALAVAAVVTLGIWEWTQFARVKIGFWRLLISGLAGAFLFLWMFGEADYLNVGRVFTGYAQPLLLLSVLWWLVALGFVLSYPNSAKIWGKSALLQFVFALLTLIPFLVGVLRLRLDEYITNPYHGVMLLLYVFVLVWAADSGAYFAGRRFGKHKLAPKVSPNKSWQGVLGGLITAALLAAVFIGLTPNNLFSMATAPFIVLSVFTVAVSILGDLTESMFKRESGIKDSSNLIPGHGGILDRIDSLTAAVPFFTYFYFYL
ncbi:phosphatidate cytidylyltransferase [Necropsobacter massiliensis]|uniref:phosphatidate cytidylyltransferase n=1 Tax=Necropsobacter massiliensis TaxID=1400001 RepID=UPI0005959193|nr:phosphatidate cytidylyltransferase [Necropsobacter massiliensis]